MSFYVSFQQLHEIIVVTNSTQRLLSLGGGGTNRPKYQVSKRISYLAVKISSAQRSGQQKDELNMEIEAIG